MTLHGKTFGLVWLKYSKLSMLPHKQQWAQVKPVCLKSWSSSNQLFSYINNVRKIINTILKWLTHTSIPYLHLFIQGFMNIQIVSALSTHLPDPWLAVPDLSSVFPADHSNQLHRSSSNLAQMSTWTLIRFWRSKVTVTSQNKFFSHSSRIQALITATFHTNV